MGRVCYHPCEDACNRGQLDTAVGINSVERFLGDQALKKRWLPEVRAEQSGIAHVVEVSVGAENVLDVGRVESELPDVLYPVFDVGRVQ